MLDKLFRYQVHPFLQLMGLIVLAVGLPMNKVLMSIGTIWLASNIVLKADFKKYWENWTSNGTFWFILGFLALHIVGLIYTDNFNYAFHDINAKLPLFVIPIAIIAFPIKRDWVNYVLYFFLASLCLTASINLITDWSNPQVDFRSISLFGSHIRYTILVVTGILVSIHLFEIKPALRVLWLLVIALFTFYIYRSQVFSGYVSLLMLIIALAIWVIIKMNNKRFKNTLLFLLLISIISILWGGFRYFSASPDTTSFSELPEKTSLGNPYLHDTSFVWYENGNHVMSFIAEKELKKSWNSRSNIDYDTLDQKGHELKSTLIRYMASKGLTKDFDGMEKMTDQDIRNVEVGYTNINQLSHSPLQRIENLKNEIHLFRRTGDPNGNSITERMEHFRIGTKIVRDYWLIGVGTGDVQTVFNEYYEKSSSKLNEQNWNRAHNQFLTFWITFGILGFIIFLSFWYYMVMQAVSQKSLLMLGFVFITIGSFLSEDTLETQQGVTFVAFFIAISYLSNYKGSTHLN